MANDPIPQQETTVTLPPPPTAQLGPEAPPAPARPDHGRVLLARLLKMADGYRAANQVHQAIEMYFHLLERYPDAPEAAQAEERLIAIGDRLERGGELRQARSLFERLL